MQRSGDPRRPVRTVRRLPQRHNLHLQIQPPLLPHVTNPLTLERGYKGKGMPIVTFDIVDDCDHVDITCSPKALGSGEPVTEGSRRFIIDFAGGDLDYHLKQPEKVEIVPSIAYGRIDRAFIVPNRKTEGFRAFVDVVVEPGQLAEMRAFLRSGGKTLTETWSYPWRAEAQR